MSKYDSDAESDVESDAENDTEEEEKERRDTIRQLKAYHRSFPDILNKKTTKAQDAQDIKIEEKYTNITDNEKLKEELADIKLKVGGTTMMKDIAGLFVSIAFFVQDTPLLKLNGPAVSLATVIQSNEAIYNSVMKEIACKYDLTKYLEPEIRLGLILAQSVGITHLKNKFAEETALKVKQPQPLNENKIVPGHINGEH